jgi:hypothetical protein
MTDDCVVDNVVGATEYIGAVVVISSPASDAEGKRRCWFCNAMLLLLVEVLWFRGLRLESEFILL